MWCFSAVILWTRGNIKAQFLIEYFVCNLYKAQAITSKLSIDYPHSGFDG
jgi:hypothetical protein